MASVRDIVHLKLQKRLIEEELKRTDEKLHRLGDILGKKTIRNPELKNPAENTLTSIGNTVEDFRIPTRRVKVQPKSGHIHDPYSTDAQAITNENILRIRQTNAVRNKGRLVVKQKIVDKEKKEKASMKPNRVAPSVRVPDSFLPNRYLRGELPCTIEHGTSGKYLSWACPLENLDYEYYLPLFFDGLQCSDPVISFIARQGIEDMLYASRGHFDRIKPVIPHLVRPLRNALSKFDTGILLGVLKALEQLITCNEGVGEILLPFGRQFLVPIAYFSDRNKNIGDAIDYGQRKQDDVGEEIRKVLELMEEHGGPKALQYLKFSIPLYESCMKRPDAHHHRDEPSSSKPATPSTKLRL